LLVEAHEEGVVLVKRLERHLSIYDVVCLSLSEL
jgi:hypothetical protein